MNALMISKGSHDQIYQRQLQQFVKSAIGKESEEMRLLFIEFLPTFIAKTAEDIRIALDTRDIGQMELRKADGRIELHGELRKYRKHRERVIKELKNIETLYERVKIQIEHWEKMRIAFNVTLPEIAGICDALTVDSTLFDLFTELHSDNAI
jgi:hypothetical protein